MKYLIIVSCCILLFAHCFDPATSKDSSKQSTSDTSDQSYIEKGQKIAMMTFGTLSSNLQKAMKEGGVSNAVKYCNMAASPLVDSLEQVHQATIRRTSLKVRNPNNLPTDKENAQLNIYQQQFDAGNDLMPVVQKTGNEITFYAPIRLMPLCENCHGNVGEKIAINDYKTVQNLYPEDAAVNYKSGDLRGMWSITFDEKQN